MSVIQLPPAIQRFVDTTNSGDSEGFVRNFTEDGHLNDWGREFQGHEEIRSWDRTDNIGVNAHFDVVGCHADATPDSFVVTLKVSGGGYNGTGPMHFQLRGDRIASVRISAA